MVLSPEELAKLTDSGATHCEEANLYGILNPITKVPLDCGKPAVFKMACKKDGRIYNMCEWCGETNVRRGMIKL